MKNYVLLLLLSLFLPKEKYVHDQAGLLSLEEQNSLNDYLTQLHTEKSLRFEVITLYSLEEADSILSQIRLAGQPGEAVGDSTLYFMVDTLHITIQLVAGVDGTILPIPLQAREPLELYGLPLIKEGSYYQGITNSIDALTQKWGADGKAEREKAPPVLVTIWDYVLSGLSFLLVICCIVFIIFIRRFIFRMIFRRD